MSSWKFFIISTQIDCCLWLVNLTGNLSILSNISVHPCDYPPNENGGCDQTCNKQGDKAVCSCNVTSVLAQDGKKCDPSESIFSSLETFTGFWIYWLLALLSHSKDVFRCIMSKAVHSGQKN